MRCRPYQSVFGKSSSNDPIDCSVGDVRPVNVVPFLLLILPVVDVFGAVEDLSNVGTTTMSFGCCSSVWLESLDSDSLFSSNFFNKAS